MSAEPQLDLLLMPTSQNLETHAVVTLEKRITIIRWLGIMVGAIALLFLYPGNVLHPMWGVILVSSLYNVFFQFYVIPRRQSWLTSGYVTSVGDVLLATAAVAATGGHESNFYLTYFLIAVLSAVRFSQKAVALTTAACLISYSSLAVLSRGSVDFQLIGLILLRVGFMGITALFVGYLGERARRAQASLAQELDAARKALAEATNGIHQTLELQGVLKGIASSSRRLLGADLALVRLDPTTDALSGEAVSSTEKGATLSRILSPGVIKADGLPPDVPVALADDEIQARCGLDPNDIRFSYVIHCPLHFEKQVLGSLVLLRLGAREEFSNLRRNLLSAFSDRAAVAVSHSRLYTQIQQQAYTDPLTGLPNHRHFQVRFAEEFKRCTDAGKPLSLLMLDINDFKMMNDTFGHAAGDTTLKEAGRLLMGAIGGSDLAARYGGDEFVVLLGGLEEAEALKVAQTITDRFQQTFGTRGTRMAPLPLSVSVGVACFPRDGNDRMTLLNKADLAMYLAKHLGKNQICSAQQLHANDPVGQILGRFLEKMEGGLVLGPGVASELEKKLRLASQLHDRGLRVEPDIVTVETISALAAAVDAKDPYTQNHSRNVATYAARLAQHLGFNKDETEKIRWAALMHDIGKIGIPDAILRKPGALTPEEMRIMQQHASIGARIVVQVQSLQPLVPLIRHHHEAWNGGGYPDGLAGETIPLGARILAVCDSFDAITSDRPYRRARPLEVALRILQEGKGTQFDPPLVDAFLEIIGDIGVLSLSTGQVAPQPVAVAQRGEVRSA